jgi:lysozyme
MKTTQTITLISAGLLLIASAATQRGNIEAGEGEVLGVSFGIDVLQNRLEQLVNQVTEQSADVDLQTASANVAAFLRTLQQAEGTANASDPYRVCFGYVHTVNSFADHPVVTGEWAGKMLPDSMCANAGFSAGCKSTAAGAYQIIRGTWNSLKSSLNLPDFSPQSQDLAAIELIRQRGALEDVKAGRITTAMHKVRSVWASLPGNYAQQGQRSQEQIVAWYQQQGGALA